MLSLIAFIVTRQIDGDAGVVPVLMAAGLAVLFFCAVAAVFFSVRFSVTFSPDGIHIRHPLESAFVPWRTYQGVRTVSYGLVEIVVRDSTEVSFRNSFVVRKMKELTGQPPVILSIGNLKGGEETFMSTLRGAERRWGKN